MEPKHRCLRLLLMIAFASVQSVPFWYMQSVCADDGNQSSSFADRESDEKVNAIDRSLILEFIKLARFNIRFQQEANRHQPWRALTYPIAREGGTAVSFGSSLVDLRERVRGFDDPRLISKSAVRHAIATSIVGNTISGSASSAELAQNTWVMLQAKRHGYSPKDSVAYVKSIVKTTDALFDQRSRLVASAQSSAGSRRLYELEERLLRRIREQLLYEFTTWSCLSREQAWSENTFYAIDAMQNFTRIGSGVIGLRAFKRPNLGGSAAICGLVSNSAATLSPLIRNVVGIAVRKYQRKKLSKDFPVERPTVTDASELAQLQKDIPEEKQSKVLADVITFSDSASRLDTILERETKQVQRLRQIAQQQTISGPLIGLTGLTGAVLGTTAFYGYRTDRETTNSLLFAGRVAAITGQGYALLNTPYTMISGLRQQRSLKKRGELPSQLLEQRLEHLDQLEQRVRSQAQ